MGISSSSSAVSRPFPGVLNDDEREKYLLELIYPRLDRFLGIPAGVVYDLVKKIKIPDERTAEKLNESGLEDELNLLSTLFSDMKQKENLIDYDDMIRFAIGLVAENDTVRANITERYRYIFVDEFQDVADDNINLLKLMLPHQGRNLFAVGDDWQAIYGFRAARVDYIINMKKHFPETVVHRLTVNYRSREEILSLSSKFIRKNRYRTRKKLISHRRKGGLVQFYIVRSVKKRRMLSPVLSLGKKRVRQWQSFSAITGWVNF